MVASVSLDTRPVLAQAAIVAPVSAADRIATLDVVRGCALFGILLMNLTGFGLSHAYDNPVNNGGSTGADLWSWIIIQVGFEGTQRGLFSMLFGAGIVLLTRKLEATIPAQASDIYVRRNLWLLAFGLFNAWVLIWMGDILFVYGVTALVAYGFRKLSPRWLVGIGLASMLFAATLTLQGTFETLDKSEKATAAQQLEKKKVNLTEEQKSAISDWKESQEDFTSPKKVIDKDIQAHRSGWRGTQKAIASIVVFLQSTYIYKNFGDAFGMMLIGMALFKLGVLTLERGVSTYVLMMLIGYGIGLPVNIAEVRWIVGHRFSLLAFSEAAVTYDVGRIAMTIGHLGLLLLFCRSGILPWLRKALAAVGQMALTNYLMHSLVCAIIFTGFGVYGALHRHQLYYIWAVIVLPQLVLSPIWLRYYRFGPMEWLWRSLTYWKRQPFRKTATAAV
jgi:uncharacterized protein